MLLVLDRANIGRNIADKRKREENLFASFDRPASEISNQRLRFVKRRYAYLFTKTGA